MVAQQQTSLGKVMPLTSYLEPEVYALAQVAANESGKSASAWVRQMVLTELVKTGKLSHETLIKLAAA